ncbi:MAG: indole-3-glycerol-phosphate synthase [Planctomycetaceae bacterium]|nr:indole-3-glycerol-phosphate synthase [Planctomycetaceae bacterium]
MKFSTALRDRKKTGTIPVIPDIKCVSPKHGDLLRGRCPIETAELLKNAGAPVMSVVTERENFGGSLELLRSVSETTGLPVLRKDFITNTDDLEISLDCGAAAILLMCATQTEKSLFELHEAAQVLGLEVLVETHTRDEMHWAKKLGATLVGINNRNITQWERDDGTVANTRHLAEFAPENAVLISESGIMTPEEARLAIKSGADAVLIGTALWQATDMAAFYQQLCGSGGMFVEN